MQEEHPALALRGVCRLGPPSHRWRPLEGQEYMSVRKQFKNSFMVCERGPSWVMEHGQSRLPVTLRIEPLAVAPVLTKSALKPP
jgi:hypothetical protein